MEQRSDAWFKAREGKVTASVSGAILGLNPWKSREEAMHDMLYASDFEGNAATDWGTGMEDTAIRTLDVEHDTVVEKCGFFTHPEYEWLGASPDGLIGDDFGLEVKCPYRLRNDKAPFFKPLKEQPWYYAQTQVQMACTGRKQWIFYQWSPHGDAIEIVRFSQEWWDKNFPKLEAFYQEYLSRKGDNTRPLEDQYHEAKKIFELAKVDLEDAKVALIDAAEGKSRKFGKVSVTLSKRKGGFDYKQACLDNDVDVSSYQKPDTEYWIVK